MNYKALGSVTFLLFVSLPVSANAVLDLFFPPKKWNQQCKDLANDLISQNGIENVASKNPDYLKNLKILEEKRGEYRRALAKQGDWNALDEKVKELNELIEKVIDRQITSLEKDVERLSRRDSARDKLRAEAAGAQLPGLRTLRGKKRRELNQLSMKREAARLRFNKLPATQPLLNEIIRLDADTKGHWLFEQLAGRNGKVDVQAYQGKAPFFVYSDGGRFLGYRKALGGGASIFVTLNSDCSPKQKAFASDSEPGTSMINAQLCSQRPQYSQLLRKYTANGKPAESRQQIMEFFESTDSLAQSPEALSMADLDRACVAMYPETQGQVPTGDAVGTAR